MKKLLKVLMVVLCIFVLVGCTQKQDNTANNQQEEETTNNVPKDQQEGTAGSNIPLKDNLEEAKYQIEVAMQYQLEQMFGDKVNDARIYVEKVYTAEEEQEIQVLKDYNLGPNEVAFQVKYELHPAEGVDLNELMVANGEYDKESGWIKDKYNVGILRENPDAAEPKYVITDFGTGF